MDFSGNESDATSHIELTELPLINGLPDDIALNCLARVPRKYHPRLRCVSKRWGNLLCSEEWINYRRKHNWDETWIYALCKDKFERVYCYVLDPGAPKRCWRRMLDPPQSCLKRKGMAFEVLGKKIYLLGGCGWSEDATDEVYCYDALKNTWSKAASLSTARCYFGCEVVDDKIYAIGGLGSESSNPQSWDTYDPLMNNWKSHTDPNIVPEIEDSIVMNKKIYIRCGKSTISSHVYAVVYDPSSGTWQHADSDMVSGWRGPAAVVDGSLYVLDESSGTRLMMWRNESREWLALSRLSFLRTRPPCRIVAIGKSVFVVGKGLSTVVFDISDVRKGGGVMVSSSIPKLGSDEDVISCKRLAI